MRILIVDDELQERKGIQLLIERFGFPLEVCEANNGSAAIDCLRSLDVDILFTDLKMPFLDGLELSRYARDIYPNIHIIFFSAYSEFEYARQAIELGVVNYIVKPIVIDEFKRIMQKTIDECQTDIEQRRLKASLRHELDEKQLNDQPVSTDIVEEIKRIVKQQYMEDLNLEDVAQKINLSAGYVSHVFKEGTGNSFVKYLNEYRLKKALYYLTYTYMKVTRISELVGYANPTYFCTVFKKKYGCTPKDYRNKRTD